MRDRTAGNAAAGKEIVEGAEPTGERAGPAGRGDGGAAAPES